MAEFLACYWDASAVLSALVNDPHTTAARALLKRPGLHLVSSLAYAETAAVLHRMVRQRLVRAATARRLLRGLEQGPWRHTPEAPGRAILRELHGRHPLRGADYWHLGLVLTLRRHLPDFALASFDRRLCEAATAEAIPLSAPA